MFDQIYSPISKYCTAALRHCQTLLSYFILFEFRCYHNPRRENEPCVAGHPCAPGLFCRLGYHICLKRGDVGDLCNEYIECKEGLRCLHSTAKCIRI